MHLARYAPYCVYALSSFSNHDRMVLSYIINSKSSVASKFELSSFSRACTMLILNVVIWSLFMMIVPLLLEILKLMKMNHSLSLFI